jgi:hypothetical protein
MDTLGAIVGPLTALGLLAALPGNYRTAFAVTLLPGLVAATLIGLVVQERESEYQYRMHLLANDWDCCHQPTDACCWLSVFSAQVHSPTRS